MTATIFGGQRGEAVPTHEAHRLRPARDTVVTEVGHRAVSAPSIRQRPNVRFFDEKSWSESHRRAAEATALQVHRLDSLFVGWLVCSSEYAVLGEPRPHVGSGGLYWIDGHIVRRDALFVYMLPPGEETSQHIHDPELFTGEDYLLLAGKARVAGEPLTGFMHTEPGADHQVVAGEAGALVAAVLRSIEPIEHTPRPQWHTRI